MRDEEDALLFVSYPCFRVNFSIIGISQIEAQTAFLWNAGGQRDLDARRFDAGN